MMMCVCVCVISVLDLLGPGNWADQFPNCASTRQSPINIVRPSYDPSLKPIQVIYPAIRNLPIVNNGHALQVDIPNGLTFTGGALPTGSTYDVVQFHLHTSSEHTVSGWVSMPRAH